MLGFDAVGRLALGQLPGQAVAAPAQPYGGAFSKFSTPASRTLAVAVITAGVSFAPRLAPAAPVFAQFTEPQRKKPLATAAWLQTPFVLPPHRAVFSQFIEPSRQRSKALASFTNAPPTPAPPPFAGFARFGEFAPKASVVFLQSQAMQSTLFIPDGATITDTDILNLPVDYYMVGLPQYRHLGDTYEPSRGEAGEKTTVSASRRGRLSGPAPGFTSKTGKRGYD